MANAQKGEVGFEVAGKEYKLRFGTNELCEAEEHMAQDINTMLKAIFSRPSLRLVRAFFAGGLGVTTAEAGELIDQIGRKRAGELVGQALVRGIPEGAKGNGEATAG